MEQPEAELLCDETDCHQEAHSFCFSNTYSTKAKVCKAHLALILDRGMSLFPISAYRFIGTPKDGYEYEDRRTVAKAVRKQVMALEESCKLEWEATKGSFLTVRDIVLLSVHKTFEDMQLLAEAKFLDMYQQLAMLKEHIDQWEKEKDYCLGKEDREMFKTLPTECPWKVEFGDCEKAVAKTILKQFRIEQVKGPDHEPSAISPPDTSNLQVTSITIVDIKTDSSAFEKANPSQIISVESRPEEDATEGAETCLLAGQEAREAADYPQALKKLLSSHTLYEQQGVEKPQLCLELGITYCHFARIQEAEAIFTRGLQSNPSDELSLKLSNALIESYYQTGQWEEVIQTSEEVYRTWSRLPLPFELLRTLYYRLNSHYELGKNSVAFGIMTKRLQQFGFTKSSSRRNLCARSKRLLHLINADRKRVSGETAKAAKLYEKGIRVGEGLWMNEYWTVWGVDCLGRAYEELQQSEKAEAKWTCACQHYAVHFPQSLQYANCLTNLGKLYSPDKHELSEEHYLKACTVFKAHYPQSHDFAQCLTNLGVLYKAINRPNDAETQYIQAKSIYEAHYPESLNYAKCLSSLGSLYKFQSDMEKAEAHYMQAQGIYEAQDPQSLDYARCLTNIGVLYSAMKRSNAEEWYLKAKEIYTASFPDSTNYGLFLYALGNFYDGKGRKKEAVKTWEEALALCEGNKSVEGTERCAAALKRLHSSH